MVQRCIILLMLIAVALPFQFSSALAQPANMSTDEAMYGGKVIVWMEMVGASIDVVVTLTERPRFGSAAWENDVLMETAICSTLYVNIQQTDAPPVSPTGIVTWKMRSIPSIGLDTTLNGLSRAETRARSASPQTIWKMRSKNFKEHRSGLSGTSHA